MIIFMRINYFYIKKHFLLNTNKNILFQAQW